ncbi:MAG TPA: LamG domain-containing protein [Firmicutes bacterium]|nr:LamG domain-containing protein [Bacillota bacterium]
MKDCGQPILVLIALLWMILVSGTVACGAEKDVLFHFIPSGAVGSPVTVQRADGANLDVLPRTTARTELTYGTSNPITGNQSIVFHNPNTGNDNGSFLYVPNRRELDLAYLDEFTIEVVLCPGELKNCVVLRRTAPGSSVGYVLAILTNGAFQFDLNSGWERLTLSSAVGMIQLGQWYHVAVTWDGVNATMYVDGRPVASGVFADWLDPVDAVLGIGAIVRDLNLNSTGQFFHGEISEIRITGKALAPVEFLRVR